MDMLKRLDAEILIGQLSYKQRADIYNEVHRYGSAQEQLPSRYVRISRTMYGVIIKFL